MEGSERMTVKDVTAQSPPDISVLPPLPQNGSHQPDLSPGGPSAQFWFSCPNLPWSFLATHHLLQGGQSPQGRDWGESCLQRELSEAGTETPGQDRVLLMVL